MKRFRYILPKKFKTAAWIVLAVWTVMIFYTLSRLFNLFGLKPSALWLEYVTLALSVLLVAFMIAAYGLFGIFTTITVFINLFLMLGILSMIGATLTLPGIAGIILTIGMAVDANVLIFERMREEVKHGRSTKDAAEAGFTEAWATILDSNLTTLVAAIVLFYFGSGPVRGFAVTLAIGIATSMFTSVTVTRLIIASLIAKYKPTKLPI